MSPLDSPARPPAGVLITEQALRARVVELGQTIARDYAGRRPTLVGVLQGAFVFMADLIRAASIDLTTDFIGVASYGPSTTSSGLVRLTTDLSMPIVARDVVIVEDVVDTGLTLDYLKRYIELRHPKTVRACALVDKVNRRRIDVRVDYVGFTIPNVFVVGYGLDYDGLYRNLPYLAVLEGPAAEGSPRRVTP
jgi:hypoxanthine phosphoribosyltransferase